MNGPRPTERGTEAPVPSPTLTQRVKESIASRGTGLPLVVVSRIVSDVAAELDRLHEAGRTYGEVGPTRIAAPLRGPAQLREPNVAAASMPCSIDQDVVGLVAAAYFALCGEPPSYFQPLSALGAHTSGRLASSIPVSPSLHRADLGAAVSDVLIKGLSSQSESRYATAGAFAAALRDAVGVSSAPPTGPTIQKHVLLALVMAAACLALVTGLWLGGHHQGRPSPPVSTPPPPGPLPTPTPPGPLPTPTPPGPLPTPTPPGPLPTPDLAPSHPLLSARRPAPRRQSGVPKAPPHLASAAFIPASEKPAVKPVLSMVPASPTPRIARTDPVAANSRRPHPASLSASYVRVYARQFLSARDVLEHRLSVVSARRVLVDGNPSRSLAAGRWASLSPGRHRLAFYPVTGAPYDPNTEFWVFARPGGRRSFQIPLPRHPGGVQGPDPRKRLPGPV